jgi:hypothetical protein
MQYRIHFEPTGAYWCIQFLQFQLFWKKVRTLTPQKKFFGSGSEIMTFPSYDEAERYVKEQGIEKIYRLGNQSSFMNPGGESRETVFTIPHGYKLVPVE